MTCVNTRSLPGTAHSVPQARAWALAHLPDSCPRADDLALVVSELVTNAVLHSASGEPTGSFDLIVEVKSDCVEVTVIDQGPALVPASRGDDVFGRGLDLVQELVDDYDVVATQASRTVWCRLHWPTTQPSLCSPTQNP